MMNFIVSVLIGGISGWVAGKIMETECGLLANIILGIIGGGVGSAILGLIGFSSHNIIGHIIVSVIGACILIAAAKAIVKK